MILSTLQDSARIESLNSYFKMAFDYIKSHDLLNEPLGKIVLDGENLFINNVLIENPASEETLKLEYHKKYLDIHVVLEGKETMGWKDLKAAEDLGDYNEAKDCAFSKDAPSTLVDIRPGQFVIVYPEDMHAPNISSTPFRKLVVKIKVA